MSTLWVGAYYAWFFLGHVGETIWGNILLEYSPSSTGNSRNWDAAIKSIIRKWQDLGIRHMAGPDV